MSTHKEQRRLARSEDNRLLVSLLGSAWEPYSRLAGGAEGEGQAASRVAEGGQERTAGGRLCSCATPKDREPAHRGHLLCPVSLLEPQGCLDGAQPTLPFKRLFVNVGKEKQRPGPQGLATRGCL